jgi:hypothetical protein
MNAAEIARDAIEKKRKITEEENIQMCEELGIVPGEWKGRTSDGKFVRGGINMAVAYRKVSGQDERVGKLSSVYISDGSPSGISIGVNKFLAYVALGKITITATRQQYQKWQER